MDIEEIRRQNREASKRYRAAKKVLKSLAPFVGVDGEGGNTEDNRHLYSLLRLGDDVIYNPKGLSTLECFNFLSEQPPGALYVGYGLDYDVTQWCKDLGAQQIDLLVHPERRQPGGRPSPAHWRTGKSSNYRPVLDVGGFQIDYMRNKYFKIKRDGDYPWVEYNDVISFFQCGFLAAIADWEIPTPEENAIIERGKAARSTFTVAMSREDIAYNELECRLLERLMDKFRDVCHGSGVTPAKWQGPGWLASAMLKEHKAPKSEEVREWVPEGLWNASRDSYYGGRFEAIRYGAIDVDVFEYDINSAYPAVIAKLPCLEHAVWVQQKTIPESGLYLAHGWYDAIPSRPSLVYGFPNRSKLGRIDFPAEGAGWYWSCEIEAAAKHQRFVPNDVWVYQSDCSCVPFRWVPEMYRRRKLLGSERGKTLKLALNSLYGKMVQSVGSAPYANPVWGSLITAMVRAQLNAACHKGCEFIKRPVTGICGEHIVMTATDGIYTTHELDLDCGDALGQWEFVVHPKQEDPYERFFVIMSGLYFSTAGLGKVKTRGTPAAKVVALRRQFYDAWYDAIGKPVFDYPTLTLSGNSFMNLTLASAWNRPAEVGQWRHDCQIPECAVPGNHVHKTIGFDWRNKRVGHFPKDTWQHQFSDLSMFGPEFVIPDPFWRTPYGVITRPHPGHWKKATFPYKKLIGGAYDRDAKVNTVVAGDLKSLQDIGGEPLTLDLEGVD